MGAPDSRLSKVAAQMLKISRVKTWENFLGEGNVVVGAIIQAFKN